MTKLTYTNGNAIALQAHNLFPIEHKHKTAISLTWFDKYTYVKYKPGEKSSSLIKYERLVLFTFIYI